MSFADAIAAAQRTAREATHDRDVVYTRGILTVSLDNVGRGSSSFDTLKGDVVVRVDSHDFLVAAEDLILAGLQTLPQRGDTITEEDAGTIYTYTVLELGNEPPWRYADDYRQQLRIHTKLTATAAVP